MLCIGCQVDKEETIEFYHRCSANANGLHVRCKDCRAEQQREYRTKNRNSVKNKAKLYKRQPEVVKRDSAFRYNITLSELEKMDTGQCHICEASLEWGHTDRKQKPMIDHCHDTNKVRGILCHRCNCALGLLDDDTDRLKIAIEYLDQIAP
jgi:hypothetical protein